MKGLLSEIRYAVRVLARAPGASAAAALTLALAIGANTAIFSVANGLLLAPLPFPEADRLVQVERAFPDGNSPSVSVQRFLFWRDHGRTVADMAAYDGFGSGFNLAGDGRPERIMGSRVSREFFSVFGVQPALGRAFLAEEDRPGGHRVVVLSDGLFRRRFGGDRAVIGRPLHLNGDVYSIVGVMPPSFRFPARSELWTPLQLDPSFQERTTFLEVTGRLRPGVMLSGAVAEMKGVSQQLRAADPTLFDDPRETATLTPLRDRLYGSLKLQVLVLLGSVGCVLLIACVNVASIQLARSTARARELAIRAALGAGPRQLAVQQLIESLLLALIGGAVGLGLGYLALDPLLALNPANIQPLVPIQVDGTVLAFTAAVSLLSGLLFGLVPIVRATRPNLQALLKEGARRATGGVRGTLLRRCLVIVEVAFALVPVLLAAQLVKSFVDLVRIDPGFSSSHLLTMKLSLPVAKYRDPVAFQLFARQVDEQVSTLPGVRSAFFVTTLPLEDGPNLPFTIEGRYQGQGSDVGVGGAHYRAVDPGYFDALRIAVLRGRAFAERDARNAEPVVLINEEAARLYWNGEDPIGKRITVGQPYLAELADPAPRTIIGVVRDVREMGLHEKPPAILYVPLSQVTASFQERFVGLLPMSFVVHTEGRQPTLAGAVEQAIWEADPEQSVTDVYAMDELVSRSVGTQRFAALLLGLLAAVALALAAVGIYGVLSFFLAQRVREIGVRMALGATRTQILRMIVTQGVGEVLAGVGLGLAGTYAVMRLLSAVLAGISARDPLSFVLAPAILVTVALAASLIPAWRASRLEPVVALQQQ